MDVVTYCTSSCTVRRPPVGLGIRVPKNGLQLSFNTTNNSNQNIQCTANDPMYRIQYTSAQCTCVQDIELHETRFAILLDVGPNIIWSGYSVDLFQGDIWIISTEVDRIRNMVDAQSLLKMK